MKKIGIITLCDNKNIGNRLQNYALFKVLDKLGDFDIKTIWTENNFKSNNIKAFLKYLKKKIEKTLFDKTRKNNFAEFNKKIEIYPVHLIYNNDINKLKNRFDYLIVGSDQVWNYHFVNNFDIFLLLDFERKKKISYAASFGINSIPEKLKPIYKKGLKEFEYISVRETVGQTMVEELSNRNDAKVLIDPTMLLKDKEWDKISKRPNIKIKSRFILLYFLGNLSIERKKEIDRVAKENNCKIINILDKKNPFYKCGPSEFLYLEKHAFLICTDSFHSSVFGIIYNTPFLVFDRDDNTDSMNSRLETLLTKFNLKDRKYIGKIRRKDLKIDCSEAYKILEQERKKADCFLKNALDIKDSE